VGLGHAGICGLCACDGFLVSQCGCEGRGRCGIVMGGLVWGESKRGGGIGNSR